MISVQGYAAQEAKKPLGPFSFQRREPGASDVLIDIHFCGVCHSDIHQARDEWGGAQFPMVPGHEIVGKVEKVGAAVTQFKVGDSVGVGCFVDSCRVCSSCREGVEQYCEGAIAFTYNGFEKDGKTPTYGGYSTKIVVNEDYVLKLSPSLPLDRAAPLLCAGITTYSPLKRWNVRPGSKIAVVGLGGLGHMAVQFGKALGAEVSVLSTSLKKKEDSLRLGALRHLVSSDTKEISAFQNYFDFIINTVSAPSSYDTYLSLLKREGTMVLVGVPDKPVPVHASSLIMKRRNLAGSLIGGIKETQEMLDFCAAHSITSEIERINAHQINEAYERMIKGDVRFRFVIDIKKSFGS